MADLVRRKDWSQTPLGPMDRWPQPLRTAVDICLLSQLPMFVWWGPDLINIYNDAYAPVLGKRHPHALGQPARQIWADIWPDIAADVDRVVLHGQSVLHERVRFVMDRNGYPEETFFTYSHSPIPDGQGGIGGLFQVCTDETQRVRAELERDRAAAQSRSILESITDAFFALDRHWRFTYLNAHAQRILGRSPGDLLGKVIWDEYPGLLGSDFERTYRAAAAPDRTPGSVTSFYPDHDRFYEVHAYPPATDDTGISVYFRDVTRRKRDEQTLRDIAARFERHSRLFDQISSTTPDFIYVFGLDYRFLYANRRLLEVWGRSFDDAVGKSLPELGYPDWHVAMHHRELDHVVRTKQPIKGEVPFTGGSGISGVYEYIFTPVLGPDGQVEVIAGTTRDVTDRKRAEQDLAAAKDAAEAALARWRAVVTHMADGVTLTAADGSFVEWNPAAVAMHGFSSPDEVRAKLADIAPLFEISSPDGAVIPFDQWPIPRLFRGESFTRWETRVRRTDVDFDRIISYSGTPLRDRDGNVALALLTLHDVTDERRTQAALRDSEHRLRHALDAERAARADAERAGRIKDEFLATLSHELRTPLNAIVGWSQILRAGSASPDDIAEGAATIERNARAQAQIIEDLLDMSRIVSGKLRLDVQPVDLADTVRAAVDTVRHAADAKGLHLHTLLDPLAGPVSGDPNRLHQVLWNLLTNAVKFTPKGGKVHVLLRRVNSHVEISVADTGEGIPPDFLPHVFDRFRQADSSTTRRHGGLGLGLNIVKQLVEMHGGTIRVKSPGPGQGSTFTLELPVAITHHPHATPPSAGTRRAPGLPGTPAPGGPLPADAAAPDLKDIRVLAVDDDPDARALVQRLLEGSAASVRTAASAPEALALLPSFRPHVLVSDIGMPTEDGYSLIKKVRSLPPDQGGTTPAVALTAYARTDDRIRALSAGFQMHIVKPIEPAELLLVVASLSNRLRP